LHYIIKHKTVLVT